MPKQHGHAHSYDRSKPNSFTTPTVFDRRRLEHHGLIKAKRQADRQAREQTNVRKTVYSITQADPTNIISVRRGCCRFCWGENYEYQRTDWELDRDLNRFLSTSKRGAIFNKMGGGGYVKTKDPNPKCPICLGEGESYTSIQDFRKLSNRDRQLISGVKIGKNGMVEEIRFHDKIAAVTTFAKLDGMIIEKKVVKVFDASEEELNEYFNNNMITINNDDPAFAMLADKAKVSESASADEPPVMAESPMKTETRLERIRRLKREGYGSS